MIKKRKILVVEDDRDINRTLEIFLNNLGYDVLKSFDGEDGLEQAKTQNPDLIVLDLRLPRLTGEALCRELKRSDEYKHIPIIMLTAKDTDADRIIGRVIGAEVYLTKPCELNILEENIETLLKKPNPRKVFDKGPGDIAWCPGCGNFGILNIIKDALAELSLPQQEVVFVSGIGQAAKIPQYMNVHYFNGLHGRALPPATAIKVSNPRLTVIAQSGDGDMYGEGGNHFIHCIRRNPNITNIVHNNMVYGLTKGQASPTSARGLKTPVQVNGVILEPFNPIAVAIALDASFVARVYVAEKDHAKDIIKKAIVHKGYALIDFLQPCVTFNKINTYKWFKENTYLLKSSHDVHNRVMAFEKAIETEKLPLGIFYINERKPVFEQQLTAYQSDKRPLFERTPDLNKLNEFVNASRN